jgi:hypothetical protein
MYSQWWCADSYPCASLAKSGSTEGIKTILCCTGVDATIVTGIQGTLICGIGVGAFGFRGSNTLINVATNTIIALCRLF